MSELDANICQHRRAPGVSERNPSSRQKVVERDGLQRPEWLSWPRNQFGESASIAELMAEGAQLSTWPEPNDEGSADVWLVLSDHRPAGAGRSVLRFAIPNTSVRQTIWRWIDWHWAQNP